MNLTLRHIGSSLGHVRHGHVGYVVAHPAEPSVLGLQLCRQLVALTKRRVLELEVPQHPMLPALTRIDNRVIKLRLWLAQKIRHVFLLGFQLEMIKEDAIVDISVMVFGPQHFIVEDFLQLLPFHPLIKDECYIVKSAEDGIIDWLESAPTDFIGIGVEDQQKSHHFELVLLNCSDERGFSIGSSSIYIGVVLLEQQLSKLEIAIDSSSMQRCGFGISCEVVTIDEIRSLFEYFFDIRKIISFDVVEQVLSVGVAVSYTLHCAHLTEAIKQLIYTMHQSIERLSLHVPPHASLLYDIAKRDLDYTRVTQLIDED